MRRALGNLGAESSPVRSWSILTLGGTSGITLDLNPTRSFSLIKATLLR
jgi:hypothetical protein